MLRKACMTIASAAALSALVMVSVAGAADKLIVNNSGGSAVFKVDDAGTAIIKRIGLGTSNPQASFHNVETSVDPSRGGLFAQHNDGAQAASIVFRKSRGTEAAPTVPIAGDYIGIFTATYWNGVGYDRPAQFGFRNDGPLASGPATPGSYTFPTAIIFYTGASTQAGDPLLLSEKLRVSSAGNIVTGNAGGVATGDLTTTATNGFLYIPTVSGALASCSTVTTYTGHVPVWFDTTNAKICTCQGGALKCTPALQ